MEYFELAGEAKTNKNAKLLDPPLEENKREIKENIEELASTIKILEAMKATIGGKGDDNKFRHDLYLEYKREKMGRVQDLFFTIKDLVGELRELPARSLGPNDERNQIIKGFQNRYLNLKDRFQTVCHNITKADKRYVHRARMMSTSSLPSTHPEDEEIVADGIIEEELQIKQNLEYLDSAYYISALVEDREKDVMQIEKIMISVKEITDAMADEVEKQDAMYESIAANIRHTVGTSRKAYWEIHKSERHMDRGHKLMGCCICIIAFAILLIILLVETNFI